MLKIMIDQQRFIHVLGNFFAYLPSQLVDLGVLMDSHVFQ